MATTALSDVKDLPGLCVGLGLVPPTKGFVEAWQLQVEPEKIKKRRKVPRLGKRSLRSVPYLSVEEIVARHYDFQFIVDFKLRCVSRKIVRVRAFRGNPGAHLMLSLVFEIVLPDSWQFGTRSASGNVADFEKAYSHKREGFGANNGRGGVHTHATR